MGRWPPVCGVLLALFAAVRGDKESDTFYSFTAKDIDGNDFHFKNLRDKIVLIVNVASECGYTDTHYRGLKMIHDTLQKEGIFEIVAFPCNQFGEQEPGGPQDIKKVAFGKYQVNFPIMSKINVIGSNAHPLYKFLAEQTNREPNWNFWKYLVSADGHVIKAYPQHYTPDTVFDDLVRHLQVAKRNMENAQQSHEGKGKYDEL